MNAKYLTRKVNQENWYPTPSSDRDSHTTTSEHYSPILEVLVSPCVKAPQNRVTLARKSALQGSQIVRPHYWRDVVFWTYHPANHST